MRPVLLLSSAFGEGHNAAARNLREALVAADPGLPAHLHDPFQEAYGLAYRGVQKLYLAAINRAPRVWEWCFDILDHTPAVKWQMAAYGRAARRLEALLDEIRPGVIVSSYPGCNHLLSYVARHRLHRPYKLLTVITDSVSIHSSWHSVPSDAFAVINDESASVLVGRGIPRSKVLVTGFPVPVAFAGLARSPQKPPAPGEPWKVLYMVNFAAHLARQTVKRLLEIPEIQLTATVGQNERLGSVLSKLPAPNRPLSLVGWTSDMPALMASHHLLIAKAGGATVQESLAAGLPMLIAHVIPGQEEGNARLVVERGAGVVADSPDDIPRLVKDTFSSGGALWARSSAIARSLGTPHAAGDLATIVLDMARPDPSRAAKPSQPAPHESHGLKTN